MMVTTYQRTFFLVASLFVTFLLTACGGEEVGPSEEKVSLDYQDRLNTAFDGLVQVENFNIGHREAPAEDRVNLEVTVKYSVDEAQVDQAIEAFHARQRIVRSYNNPPNKTQLMMLNGKEEHATIQYRQQAGNVWTMDGVVPN